ncbi:2353_t:CDS:2, partial [Racocetra persica]
WFDKEKLRELEKKLLQGHAGRLQSVKFNYEALIAQWIERLFAEQEAGGSIPPNFWLGRITTQSQSSTSQNNQSPSDNSEVQALKSQLKEVKNQLKNLTNEPQKNQLEDKITALENKVKELTNPDKSTIRQLEKEIKEIKEKLENTKPDDNPSPTDNNQLQFKVYYFGKVGENHMWPDVDTENSNKIILIDKENIIFPNDELTQKGQNYTITFLPQNAEKFHNQSHVYYFSKHNDKFNLAPVFTPSNEKKEIKVEFFGDSLEKGGYGK